ncbi:MAG: hypothetical protein ACJA0Q_002237 [Saprospiraceae bacterium]|jgi:hypothetical protein
MSTITEEALDLQQKVGQFFKTYFIANYSFLACHSRLQYPPPKSSISTWVKKRHQL